MRADTITGLGTGLTEASVGVQSRYELTRGLAPYVNLSWGQKFGATARLSRSHGENPKSQSLNFGIRWMF